VVWALGDGADGSPEAIALAQRIAAGRVDRFLYLGDVYEEGTAEEFQRNYEPVFGALRTVTSPTPGDHEWRNHEAGYDPYWGPTAGEGVGFYAYRLAGWRIVSVNSEVPQDPAQLRFLGRQMAGPGNCRLVFWHRPRFSAGTRHGDEPGVEPFWRLVRGHAAIVVGANDHDMQRMKPNGGTTQFVSGAGQAELYPVKREDPRLAFADDSQLGALRLALSPGRARASFVGASGRVLDSTVVRCRA